MEQNRLEELEKFKDLWENPGFQDWVAGVQEELTALRELPWAMGGRELTSHAEMLKHLGMDVPQGREELYEAFSATRAVVHYVGGKLGLLESRSKAYYKLLKRVQERERDEADGT